MKEIVNTYTDNLDIIYKNFEKHIDDIKFLCENTPNKISKNIDNNNSIEITSDNVDENTLCKILDDIMEWTNWSANLIAKSVELPLKTAECIALAIGETQEFINELLSKSVEYIVNWINEQLDKFKNSKFIKKIIKKLKLITLKIKKALLNGQLKVYNCMNSVLLSIKDGKFVGAMNATFGAIINAIKSVCAILDNALLILDTLIKSLGTMFLSLDGGTMGFFATPKTLINGKIKLDIIATEPNNDICNGVAELVVNGLNEIIKGIKLSNKGIKEAYIASQIAKYELTGEIPDGAEINLTNITTDEIKNKLLSLLSLFIQSEALPKYENLKITNLGFLAWLTLSFEPAMKQTFGLPGYP